MNQCAHENDRTRCVCQHLRPDEFDDYFLRFSGCGAEYAAVCHLCQDRPWDELNRVCDECFWKVARGTFGQCGTVGRPEIIVAGEERCELEMLGRIEFPHRILAAAKRNNRWLVLLEDQSLHMVDPFGNESEAWGQISGPCELNWAKQLDLVTSADGRYAAITNRYGSHGLVWDLNWNRTVMQLDRGHYHPEQTPFPVCFFGRGDETRLIVATAWNRLDIFDPATGGLLTPRTISAEKDAQKPSHHLDYVVGELLLSPDEGTILVDGWVWHPVGVVGTVDLDAWRRGATFACEDGLNEFGIRNCNYKWNVGKAFLSDHEVVLWGIGNDDEHMVDGAVVYDLRSRKPIRWFAGPPNARFVAAEWLFCFSPEHDTTAWDVKSGERVWYAPGHRAAAYNKNFHHFLSWSDKTLEVSRWNEKQFTV